ncbi:hypothetical protein TI04_08805, partial [Achromatium sp. WMS2]
MRDNTMSKSEVLIDSAKLFSQINVMRTQQGLAVLNLDTFSTHTNLRFALSQNRYLNLKKTAVELTLVEAEALCAVIEELFKVRLNLDGVKASAGSTNETKYQLVLEKLYASIHKQRQL